MYNKLFTELINTRTRLQDAAYILNIPLASINIDELDNNILCCAHCYIWRSKDNFVMEDEMPVCHFCADMSLLRF